MLFLNSHTPVNHFVRYVAHLTFFIILQAEKIVNTFCKKCLHFYKNRGKIKIYVYKFPRFDLVSYTYSMWDKPHSKTDKKNACFPFKIKASAHFYGRKKVHFRPII